MAPHQRDLVSDYTLLSTLLQDDQDGVFLKWRVENSWGEDHGHKGELNLVIPAVSPF